MLNRGSLRLIKGTLIEKSSASHVLDIHTQNMMFCSVKFSGWISQAENAL